MYSEKTAAQTDPVVFDQQLTELAKVQPGLMQKVQVSVTGITLSDFITAIAFEHNLNVSVDDQLKTVMVTNFYDALVKDVFVFLVKKYEFEIDNCPETARENILFLQLKYLKYNFV